MKQEVSYILATGEADQLRLQILNKLYNPVTQQFLLESGLKPGMEVLEVGCGIGEMACWLANAVGEHGKVTAIDISAEQLSIAKRNAEYQGIKNIRFVELDVRNLSDLKQKFDLTYGRWVLIFLPRPEEGLKAMYESLKSGGILTYEDTNAKDAGHFSYPHSKAVDAWFEHLQKNFANSNLEIELATKYYQQVKKMGCRDLAIKTNQPVLITAREKSVLRLAIMSFQVTYLSATKRQKLIQQLAEVEKEDIIVGFVRNLLIKGIKE